MERPVVTGSGTTFELVRLLYRLDAGWNVFPSLHVAHSVLVTLLYLQHDRRRSPLVAAGTALIALSTVLVKQHYIVDVPAGALLAWLCYRAVARYGDARPMAAGSDMAES
jgi:membrane-associated phospholipid phosphatase